MNKKILLAVFLLLSAHFCSFAQIVNIPDMNFKNALLDSLCVDTNGDDLGDADADINNDGEIQVSEAIAVTALIVSNDSIQSLAGIEYFSQLTILNCESNQLTTLDLNGLSNLQFLDCSNNQLITLFIKNGTIENTLDFSVNSDLSYICCDSAQLTAVYNLTLRYGQADCVIGPYCPSYINASFDVSNYEPCEAVFPCLVHISDDCDFYNYNVIIECKNCCGTCQDSVLIEVLDFGDGDVKKEKEYFVIEDDVILFQDPFNLNSSKGIELNTPVSRSSWRWEAEKEQAFSFVSGPMRTWKDVD